MTNTADVIAGARSDQKANSRTLIEAITEEFFELHGDLIDGDDPAIIAGLATMASHPVMVIATEKGHSLEERMATHFGSPEPMGYRKALRVMKLADQLGFPILTLINTPGAYPGADAEAAGQGQMIAKNIQQMLAIKVPIIAIILGEAGSGGALALACADEVWMLDHSMYSILSPEGFASIMWKDAQLADKAAELMHLTPEWLLKQGAIHRIIDESAIDQDELKNEIVHAFQTLSNQDTTDRLIARENFFRKF